MADHSPSGDDGAVRLLHQAGLWVAAVAAVQVLALAFLSTAAAVAGAMLFLAVVWLLRRGLRDGYPHARFGLCNGITLLRAAVATGLVATVTDAARISSEPALAWTVVALAAASLSLDGVDGWLARRSGLASDFGARFDMEVDSGFALMLALGLMATGKAGAWVLLLGGLRYAFVLAFVALPWLDRPLPDRQSRKTVCVIQIATLIALHAPVIQPPLSTGLAAAATLALVWSFALDVVWLWRRR